MSPTATAPTNLNGIGSTALYRPAGPETFVFLRWNASEDPAVPMEATWADVGPPPIVGYFVFLPAVPSAANAPSLEEALRANLSVPVATGLVWARFAAPSTLDMLGTLAVALAADDPVVGGDAPVAFPKGMPQFTFADGMRLSSMTGMGGLEGLVVTSPHPSTGAGRRGVALRLLGPAFGCITFQALLESVVVGDRTTKPLAAAQLDPLRPYDHQRTWVRTLGRDYVFSVDATGVYHLMPVPEGGVT